ncbi:protein-tyrosine phosphatase mitochondrial [Arabis alpina]|uniref:Protein-tyrosine phosphatase mitochondrial n=1 Tax=Arabis alpina TaxID=50452 RepID=A0A087H2W3_ARAAL|nr:protein-tyrosine phosphatase mitochondrial [Arabis alpina]
MYIEELTDKAEKEERLVDEDGDKAVFVSRGNVVVLTTKRALVGVGARALFYPTLIYNVVRNKLESEFQWWDRVAEFILLGAVPFQSDVPRLKEEGVCGVITLTEPYETLVPSSLYKSYCIDHLVIATTDYCFAPSLEAICQAVDFIHRNALLGKTTYVHCKAGRGRSTTVVICYLVHHKNMTPEAAYSYVRSIRPRVLLAATQWKAVLEYYHVRVLSTQRSLTDATSALIPRNVKQVCSGNVVVFDDGSMVVVTHSDLEGYDDNDSGRSVNVARNKLWAAAADLSMVYRVKVVGQAALARISYLWLGLREDQKLSGKNISMGGISVDISVY